MTDRKLEGGALSRRTFLEVAGAAPLALAAGVARARAAAGIPIALQLYSLRGDCKADFDACLDAVAKMGFTGVEFAGYFGYAGKGADLRKRLDGLGLKAAGTHIGVDQLAGDALKQTIEFHQAIGCRFLVSQGSGNERDGPAFLTFRQFHASGNGNHPSADKTEKGNEDHRVKAEQASQKPSDDTGPRQKEAPDPVVVLPVGVPKGKSDEEEMQEHRQGIETGGLLFTRNGVNEQVPDQGDVGPVTHNLHPEAAFIPAQPVRAFPGRHDFAQGIGKHEPQHHGSIDHIGPLLR